MCEAVGEQADHERRWKQEAVLSDVLIASIVLADALKTPEPRVVATEGINAFLTVRVKGQVCDAILVEAEKQISLVYEALAA
jgi:hypothetical protein